MIVQYYTLNYIQIPSRDQSDQQIQEVNNPTVHPPYQCDLPLPPLAHEPEPAPLNSEPQSYVHELAAVEGRFALDVTALAPYASPRSRCSASHARSAAAELRRRCELRSLMPDA